MKTTIILGAGFSKNAGLPVQSEIPQFIIKNTIDNEFEVAVSNIIETFIKDVFNSKDSNTMPEIDDIFTNIDMSTISGHHLGIDYSPLKLSAVRKYIVYRVFDILEKKYNYSNQVIKLLSSLITCGDDVSFIILNWDTVLENCILSLYPQIDINYCNGAIAWGNTRESENEEGIKILKVHGSSNWLYCDNCRTLFYDLYGSIPLIQKVGFEKLDLEMFCETRSLNNNVKSNILNNVKCSICDNRISSHIATFSYRKSFKANTFSNVWNEAEKQLSNSQRWVFIGYSLPEADYEFKHLLKISELKLRNKKTEKLNVDVVLLNSTNTITKYKKFFGSSLGYICNGGISQYLEHLRV